MARQYKTATPAPSVGLALRLIEDDSRIMTRLNWEYNRTRVMRDNRICDAMDNNVAVRELQKRTGLSRQQIHNISNKGPQPVPPPFDEAGL